MEIIHDITILITLGIILQFIEKCIVHSEKWWYNSQTKLFTKQLYYFYTDLIRLIMDNIYESNK